MNWCRELDVMTAEQFMLQYNSLSTTAKKQLLTIPAINNHQTTCTFPWSGFNLSSLQERSPPITQAVPLSSGPDLPHPDTNDLDMTIPIENNQQEGDEQQNELVPNRRRRMDSTDSSDSYQTPRTTNRRQSTETRVNEFEDVQRLLRTFAEQRKYQRYSDNRPVPQPVFATAQYNELLKEQPTEDQELLAKLCIDIKENLYLAYENESRANLHHFVVAEKLVKLKERIEIEMFDRMLLKDFSISKKIFARYLKGMNYDHGEKEINVSDTDSEDESVLMTIPEFQKSSHWYNFKQADFHNKSVPFVDKISKKVLAYQF
ncbi:hypothetical protein BATDEDRAFT_88395 [Batrachochytrium dendrobatidis JAM81]|uniref:Uncharacterized protein n=1 Tax=Batrachochytrium dendrobatidis (strain JAM81 / FGSC 10211) TaxID=684364 RepID=F4P129_BATDJ|nr:uncharacterized protein BATDEDRAFT_88395 [Batrachochytrium dendrobatidis JAM81]EGF80717.1 hypothetical protein BATDEDRAFT_88395 [Batrachochytrium dendrobatidis JAM81]|eukprot:XP_006678666.1 hypothetical protein BATDEDRAFT_88395 [Batrachochytrium dendrobatidis JAM81]